MSVAVLSANLGAFDAPVIHVPQEGVSNLVFHTFTSENFPPRPRALTLRLQSKIPKMFGWDLVPDHDVYLWLDGSLSLSRPDSVAWFVSQLGPADILVFTHPWRTSVRDEAEFLRQKLASGSHYITSRYLGEDLDGQMAALPLSPWYPDDHLFAAGAFCYRPTAPLKHAMKEWWYHTSRFHCIDQLSFPWSLAYGACTIHVVDEDIYHASHLHWNGHRRRG